MSSMGTRTTQRNVTFHHPFSLPGSTEVFPPGVYLTQTDEESLDVMAVEAWRRTATTIHVEGNGRTQVITVAPSDLEEALSRDRVLSA